MRQLVQALLRILGIFYCIKSVDTIAGGVYALVLHKSMMSAELSEGCPNPWALLLPLIFLYLLIAFGLFLAAPTLSRLIVPKSKDKGLDCGSLDLAVVVSSAMLISVWAFLRLVDYVTQFVDVYVSEGEVSVPESGVFFIICNLIVMLTGFLMIKKMPKLLKWLKTSKTAQPKD